MAGQGLVDHGATVREFADPNGKLAETQWEREVQGLCRREAGLVAEVASQLRGIDADARLSDAYKREKREAVLARYSEALAGFDRTCAEKLDQQQAEAEATLARPLSIMDQTTLAAQADLIRTYAKSMSAADLVARFRQVVDHGTPACGAAWAEFLPAWLAGQQTDERDPMRAAALMTARAEADRIAEAFRDAKAPLRPRARQTLADLKRVRELVAAHRMNRLERSRQHPAFGGIAGHDLERFVRQAGGVV